MHSDARRTTCIGIRAQEAATNIFGLNNGEPIGGLGHTTSTLEDTLLLGGVTLALISQREIALGDCISTGATMETTKDGRYSDRPCE
jgi:hypothetical protein